MSNSDTLHPDTMAVALVGRFLQHWGALEPAMREAIGNGLRLGKLETVMVCCNMQLRDKINLLKTLAEFRLPKEAIEQKRFKDALEDISDLSWIRNMMAHDVFAPSPDRQGVQFLVMKAKGKLDFPETIWPASRFYEEASRVGAVQEEIKALSERFQSINAAEKAATDAEQTKQIAAGVAVMYRLLHRPQPVRGSILSGATEKTDSETPPDPPK
jgi:hypothetical protein